MLQALLDVEAMIGNITYQLSPSDPMWSKLNDIRAIAHNAIITNRGPAPTCYGEDDCSTMILSMCPWRLDCGDVPTTIQE